MTEFTLIVVTMYFIVYLFVTNGTIVRFCSLSSFSGDEGFGGYMFDGFIRVVREVNDGSSVCRWFLQEYLFDRRGSGGCYDKGLILCHNDKSYSVCLFYSVVPPL